MDKTNDEIPRIGELHPCQYCGNTCRGRQCRDCHLKMVASRNGNCTECGAEFTSIRKDGSMRKRCSDCQGEYNQKYMSMCPCCGDAYHACLRDGRIFDKCYKCYRSTVTKCQKCEGNAYNGYALCRDCHQSTRSKISDTMSETSDRTFVPRTKFTIPDVTIEEHKCNNKDCGNLTRHVFCKECYIQYKFATQKVELVDKEEKKL